MRYQAAFSRVGRCVEAAKAKCDPSPDHEQNGNALDSDYNRRSREKGVGPQETQDPDNHEEEANKRCDLHLCSPSLVVASI
jgi:hypothetical protein